MKFFLMALLVIVLLLIFIMFLKLKVIIRYYHGNDNDHLKITFKALFGLIKYKINIPVIKVAEDAPAIVVKEEIETGPQEKVKQKDTKKFTAHELLQSFQDMKQLLEHVVGFYKIIRSFLRKVTMSELEWFTVVGVGDAAATGMISGAFWTVKGSLLGIISSFVKMRTMPKIMITPSFNRAVSETSFQCMIHFRIGHAIFAGIKLLKHWKGGKPHFKTKPLANLSGDKANSL